MSMPYYFPGEEVVVTAPEPHSTIKYGAQGIVIRSRPEDAPGRIWVRVKLRDGHETSFLSNELDPLRDSSGNLTIGAYVNFPEGNE